MLIIGIAGVYICKIIGIIVLVCYLLLCIIEQFFIRSASLKESDNPEFNKFMDGALVDNNQGEDALPPHEKIINMVEDIIKSKDNDLG